MKITKEHHKWIAESTPTEGTSSAEKVHWISGASEAIEKFGGIPWKEVNEVNDYPPKNKELLSLSPDGIVYLCFWREAYRVFSVQSKKESTEGWQWAEINLPNQ